ncbi:MAG: LytTR family DNA-binding domain-containing protein [Bacteroidetes bacterium]|nr:LytTR family DNA-binding domain-containing protein [Bacteroidota bacterium]
MIKAVIIDDEKKSRDALIGLIDRYCPEVFVLAQADGCMDGIEKVKLNKPDIVFLDIQMPDGSGFNFLEAFDEFNFEVIFATAHDQFAIKAIKYSALDYLLKPINPDDLKEAIQKYIEKQHKGEISNNIKVLLDNMKLPNSEAKKIILSTSEGIHVIGTDEIIRCESDDYYTKFFLTDGKTILISKTLKQNEAMLSDFNFIRPHKSHLVNIKYIKSYLKVDGGYILMTDGCKIPVSRRKRDSIISMLNHL